MTARLLPWLAFLAASFVLALVMLAPTQALAHAGHDHGVIDTSPKPTPVRSIVPTAEPSNKNSSPRLHTAVTVDIEQSSASEVTSGIAPNKLKSCSGGCCQSAGAHWCPVTLLSASLSFAPEKSLLFSPIVSRGAGITPGALSKPPRSLV